MKEQNQELAQEDRRDKVEFWFKWIRQAQDAKYAEKHRKASDAAWAEYENSSDGAIKADDDVDGSKNPIYWSACETLLPAYYSKTPETLIKRKFDINDDPSLTAGIVGERLSAWLMEGTDFDGTMTAACQDYVHCDKATTQACFEADIVEQEIQVPVIQVGENEFVTEDGQEFGGEVKLLPDTGMFIGLDVQKVAVNKKFKLKPAPYDEVLHTPNAKTWEEIEDVGLYFCLSREDAEKKFGKENCKYIVWKKGAKHSRMTPDTSKDDTIEMTGEFVEGYECQCLTNKKIYWVSDQKPDGFLKTSEDMWELEGFFAIQPFIIGSKPSKHLYPTPAHTHLLPLLNQLHEAQNKVYDLIDGIERRAIVNGDEDLVTALNSSSNTYVVAKNFQNLLESGGLQNNVLFLPVQELVNAIGELNGLEDRFKAQFYEYFGLPDILRGISGQYETVGAQQLKATAAHDRFKYRKRQIKTLAKDSLNMLIDLALKMLTDEELAEIVGFAYLPPAHQQRFPEALAILRDDKQRLIRIDLDTDSLSFMDEQLRSEQMIQAVGMVTQGLQNVSQTVAQNPDNPEFAHVSLMTLLKSLETVAPGKQFQDEVKQAVGTLIEKIKNPPPPPPPPPDYEMLKIQQKSQEAQMKLMIESQELAQKQQKIDLQAQKDMVDTQLSAKELGIKEMKIALDTQSKQFGQQLEATRVALEDMTTRFNMQLESERLQIERFDSQMQAAESMQEEVRLARENNLEIVKAAAEFQKELQPPVINVPEIKIPPAQIQLALPQRKGRKGRMMEPDGSFTTFEIDGDE